MNFAMEDEDFDLGFGFLDTSKDKDSPKSLKGDSSNPEKKVDHSPEAMNEAVQSPYLLRAINPL